MLVPDLAGVIWLWPFTALDHIYGRSNFGHRFCLLALWTHVLTLDVDSRGDSSYIMTHKHVVTHCKHHTTLQTMNEQNLLFFSLDSTKNQCSAVARP